MGASLGRNWFINARGARAFERQAENIGSAKTTFKVGTDRSEEVGSLIAKPETKKFLGVFKSKKNIEEAENTWRTNVAAKYNETAPAGKQLTADEISKINTISPMHGERSHSLPSSPAAKSGDYRKDIKD